MYHLFKENLGLFAKGAFAGLVAVFKPLFLDTGLASFWVLKVGGVIVVPLLSGFLTVLASDLYKAYLKPKLFPHDKSKEDDKTKAA